MLNLHHWVIKIQGYQATVFIEGTFLVPSFACDCSIYKIASTSSIEGVLV